MTIPDTLATLEVLSREMVECPCNLWHYAAMHSCAPGTHTKSCACHGTGLVLRCPELTEECSPTHFYLDCRAAHDATCCSGTGRVLKQGPALLVAVLHILQAGWSKFSVGRNPEVGWIIRPADYYDAAEWERQGIGDTLEAAAVQALAALAQRGKDAG